MAAARAFQYKVDALYTPTLPIQITGKYTDQGWFVDPAETSSAMNWLAQQPSKRVAWHIPDKEFSRIWIRYRDCQIEMPTERHLALHFYDEANDSLVVFYVIYSHVALE